MHIAPVAASLVSVGVSLGGVTTSFHTDTPEVGQNVASVPDDNNGNG